MKTHNAFIFHCLRCGNVAHRELNEELPRCCGCEMVQAAVETIHHEDADHDDLQPLLAGFDTIETDVRQGPRKG